MTVSSIILDLHGPTPIITNPNISGPDISSMTVLPCPTIDVAAMDICAWITSKGGWTNLAIFDIMTLVSAYLGQTNLGFTVTIAYIQGAIAYYLGRLSSGNSSTGCTTFA